MSCDPVQNKEHRGAVITLIMMTYLAAVEMREPDNFVSGYPNLPG